MTDVCSTAAVLDNLAVIKFAGADTVKFLQGQLTNDITKLAEGSVMIAGYCSPKGRMIAALRLVKTEDAVLAIVPKSMAESLAKRLKMFVMRSKVTVTIEESIRVVGFVGNAPEGFAMAYVLPSAPAATLEPFGLPAGHGIALVEGSEEISGCRHAFWAAELLAGRTWVWEETREAFVPQAANLELVGGVSFTKGCYTGQEVVSRVEHIGKTNRRAACFVCEGVFEFACGSDVAIEGENDPGIVIQSVAGHGKTILFLQCRTECARSAELTINGTAFVRQDTGYGYTRA